MTTLLITTIRRHTPYTEPSGYLYTYNLEEEMVLQRHIMAEPAYRQVDTNPRGGIRGSRGISIRPDQLALANAAMIFRYDPEWNLLGAISHPACNAIHDIHFGWDSPGWNSPDTLWVTSARNDQLYQFALDGNLLSNHDLRLPSPAITALKWKPPVIMKAEDLRGGPGGRFPRDFRDPRTHEEEVYDRAHVNSLCLTAGGDMLVSLGLVLGVKFATLLRVKNRLVRIGLWQRLLAINRGMSRLLGTRKNMHSDLVVQPARGHSAVFCIQPDGAHRLVLALSGMTVPSHSLLPLPDGSAIYLNTTEGCVVHFSPTAQSGVLSSTRITDGFLRGATLLPNQAHGGLQLVFGSKGELLKFDLASRRLLGSLRLTADANESIYDIKILPAHYAPPPASFEEHFEKQMGFRAEELILGRKPASSER
jgi:hypothetical protein